MDFHDIFLKDSLYTKYDISSFEQEELLNILFHNDNSTIDRIKTLDSYCPICGKHTTFISDQSTSKDFFETLSQLDEQPSTSDFSILQFLEECSVFERKFKCPRPGSDSNHDQVYVFRITNSSLIKIGQSPSIADLAKQEIDKYRSLDENIYKELNRAIGLASYGIGVGSFVYLRRIIEKHIVNPILQELLSKEQITSDKLFQADFKGKINLAKDSLPEFLVENKKIYSVLSSGIHELEEKQCNELFPILRTSIEIILDEKIEKLNRDKKNKLIVNALNKI